MDVATFVEEARRLGRDADRVLLRAVRDDGPDRPVAVAALRARGSDVFIPSPGRVGVGLTGTRPGGPPLHMTYEQLAAPVADRANHDLFAPLAVFPGGFRTSIRESRDRSRRQAKARATLKQRTVGLGAEQIDDLIDPIWAEHDLPPPPAHVRPLLVERVVHNPSRLDDLRTTADIVQGYAKWGSRIVNLIRHQDRYTPESAGDWEPGMHVRTGPESVEVQLDGDAQSRLADLGDEAYFVARTYAAITVELRAGADGSVEVWNSSVLGRQADSRFGVVSAADAEPYRDDLAAAVASGRPLRSRAIRTQGPDETWRLYLFLPAGGQWKPP